MTLDASAQHLTALIDKLMAAHGDLVTRDAATACVMQAWEAVQYFGASGDAEIVALAERIADRELRLRLGLEREAARLDPEDHHR